MKVRSRGVMFERLELELLRSTRIVWQNRYGCARVVLTHFVWICFGVGVSAVSVGSSMDIEQDSKHTTINPPQVVLGDVYERNCDGVRVVGWGRQWLSAEDSKVIGPRSAKIFTSL